MLLIGYGFISDSLGIGVIVCFGSGLGVFCVRFC